MSLSFRNIIKNAMQAASKVAGEEMVYTQGSNYFKATFIPTESTYSVDDGTGVLMEFESKDFLVLAEDFQFDGQQVVPQRGDTITRTFCGQKHVYEVLRMPNDQVYKFSDSYNQRLRIHTKLGSVIPL